MSQPTVFEMWAIIEVMGHSKYAGYVTEQGPFIRVDVPAVKDFPEFTKLLGVSSIFAITPVAEDVARKAAEEFRAKPMNMVHFPHSVGGGQMQLDYDDGEEDWHR